MHAFSNVLSLLLLQLLLLSGSGSGGASASPAGTTAAADLSKRQAVTSKYCKPGTPALCYLEYSWGPTIPVFRVAVPDSAATGAAFDTLLQVVSPASLAWVGFAWGGGMTLNPLTVVWPNGNGATVSSRWANGRTQPTTYSSATHRLVSASRNTTHWTVETVCTGCSKWSGGGLSAGGVNTFAWAVSKTPVPQPGNAASSFSIHSNVGMYSEPLTNGKVPKAVFDAYVKGAK